MPPSQLQSRKVSVAKRTRKAGRNTGSSVLHNPQVKIYLNTPQEGQPFRLAFPITPPKAILAQASMAKVVSTCYQDS